MKEMSPSFDRVLDTVPLVVDESQVARFKFYLHDSIYTGMRYGEELYGLMREVSTQARLDAYQIGHELLLKGLPVLITASKQGYTLWINLRHPTIHQMELLKTLTAKVKA